MRKKEREVSDLFELETIISRSDVCRIAFADKDTPYIVTMNFGYVPGKYGILYFHCANEGRKLEMIKKNNYVCFEMDTDHEIIKGEKACDYGMKYSSVIGYGTISVIDNPEEKINGLNRIMAHYTGRDEFTYKPETLARTTILRLEISSITCKRT
jgi:nitroimidazol reductase NimA-like FMN-containing flavoprotein (pyridoxamine 5'-phosphate oxidase superfamily)